MNGENRMNWLSLRNNQFEVQDFSQVSDHFRGIYRIYLNLIMKNQKMSTCNLLDLEKCNCEMKKRKICSHLVTTNEAGKKNCSRF